MWRRALILVVLLGLVAGLAAGILNPQPLILDLFFVQIGAPFGVLVIAVFAVGALAGVLFAVLLGMARRSRPTAAETRIETAKALSPGHD